MSNDKRVLGTEMEYDSVSVGGISTDTVKIDLESMDYGNLEIKGAVPVDELEALVEDWKDTHPTDNLQCAARELQEVIENHD